MFEIGQQVVCVDDSVGRVTGRKDLERGRVYTIRGFDTEGSRVGLLLEEVAPVFVKPWKQEVGFAQERFRPLRKTDIGIFTALTRGKPVTPKKLEPV